MTSSPSSAAHRLRRGRGDRRAHHGAVAPRIPVTAGISVFPEDGGDHDAMLRFADAALYEAKARGAVPVAD